MTEQFDSPAPAAGAKDDGQEFDRWGRYKIPHPVTGKPTAWTRATTYAKSIADTYALTQWQMRMAVKGLASRPDLYALAASTPVDDRDKLNKIAEDAKEAAAASAGANSGTALHAFSEQVDRGENPTVPPPWNADIRAYQSILAVHGVRIRREYIERKVVVPEVGVAGTLDRLVDHRGALVVGDLKTGQNLDYGWLEIAIQLALYARATHLWDPASRTHTPMPAVDLSHALVFHVPSGKGRAVVYEVDISAGWAAAELCGQVRDWRKRKDLAAALMAPVARPAELIVDDLDALTVLIDTASSVGELERLWTTRSAAGTWTAMHTQAAKARKDFLLSTGQGRQ